MSIVPRQQSQIVELPVVNSTINANGSVSLSATIINVGLTVARPSMRAAEVPTSRAITRALVLKRKVKQLLSMLSEALEIPLELSELKETLKKLLEITLPRTIEFSSYTETNFDDEIEREINGILKLIEGSQVDVWLQEVEKSGFRILSLPWPRIVWLCMRKGDVRRLNGDLEKSCSRIHNILLRESLVPYSGAGLSGQQIQVEDFFGVRWFLPLHQCLDISLFKLALQARFKGGSAEGIVTRGRFQTLRGCGSQIIKKANWREAMELLIELDEGIQLSVLIELPSDRDKEEYRIVRCPRCKYDQRITSANSDVWVDCYHCESRFNVSEKNRDESIWTLDSTEGDRPGSPASGPDQVTPFKYYTINIAEVPNLLPQVTEAGSDPEESIVTEERSSHLHKRTLQKHSGRDGSDTYYRTMLNNLAARHQLGPICHEISTFGPSHGAVWAATVFICNQKYGECGGAHSKGAAMEQAAKQAYEELISA